MHRLINVKNSEKTKALLQLIILLCLWSWIFHSELFYILISGTKSSEMAQGLVAPLAIILLVYLRREELINKLTGGSWFGIIILLAGLAMYFGSIWPFNFGYARQLAIVPTLAGVILICCGWRILIMTLPILLLIILAIPIGSSLYTRLVIRPETYTISASAKVLDQLPDVDTSVDGTDLMYSKGSINGSIGLGESYRGVRLLRAFIAIGVFVLTSRKRTILRIISVLILALPIVFFSNFLRLIFWSLAVIYGKLEPVSGIPRNLSAVCSLVVLYILFVFVCDIKINLFVEAAEGEESGIEGDNND